MAGFVTPMPPPMGQPMNIPMKHPSEAPPDDEPASKKMRNEDSLIPEEVFLARNPVSFPFLSHLNLYFFLNWIIL